MKQRKVPLRKCVVSNEMKPKKEMLRIVKNKEDEVAIDPTGKMPGRGAYISINEKVAQQAWDKRLLDKQFEVKLTDEFYKELVDYVAHQEARMKLDL